MNVIERCRRVAEFSDERGAITRTFLSPAMRQCLEYFVAWATEIGLSEIAVDAAGNFRALLPGRSERRLVLGSHLDSVPNAGAFDGVLGVVLGLQLASSFQKEELACDLEIVGFSEEEGVRFGKPFIGSTGYVSGLTDGFLDSRDKAGVSVRKALVEFGLDSEACRRPLMKRVDAYLEIHIEQGPQLENLDLPLGVVDAIVGQTRGLMEFYGKASHAGTTPMNLRRDAMCAAAEWVLAVERMAGQTDGLVATVGMVKVEPGVGNVVAGHVAMTLDVRHGRDEVRLLALQQMLSTAYRIAAERELTCEWTSSLEQSATPLDTALTARLAEAVQAVNVQPFRLMSGAGHDAMIVAQRAPSAMLFVRSPGGISHHPDETVLREDVELAFAAARHFMENFS